MHVLRFGDVALCTSQFELFTDYGVRIQARSKALQTFVIQLVGPGSCLPAEKAVRGGSYSAIAPRLQQAASASSTIRPCEGLILFSAIGWLFNYNRSTLRQFSLSWWYPVYCHSALLWSAKVKLPVGNRCWMDNARCGIYQPFFSIACELTIHVASREGLRRDAKPAEGSDQF
jgi:hypothetical protein